MAKMTATDAKNKFGQLLDMAQAEPVAIEKNGREVAYVISAEQYASLVDRTTAPKVRPRIQELLARSMEERKSLYEALAK